MNRSSLWLWLVFSFVAPALYVALAFAACGVGHGNCTLMILFPFLLPFALLVSEAFPNSIGIILTLVLAQFPLYVIALAVSRHRGRYRLVRNLLIAAHGVAVVLALVFWWS
jgi:hypothetical protein